MTQFDFDLAHLPTSEELPDSDDTPVDNEDQNFLPNLLLFLLDFLWKDREDWYFGVDMGIYHTTGAHPRVPVVPDGFLSLEVERRKRGKSRRSYVTWEENGVVPRLALEIVSWTPGGEYDEKQLIYQHLGVLYYVIYNPEFWRRDEHQPFEIYKLIRGQYQLQIGEPFWMPEIGLGIGRYLRDFGAEQREVLGWYNASGERYLSPDEQEALTRQQLEQERQRVERLAERLRALGEDPDLL
jgi:Uma2 family endonuclease